MNSKRELRCQSPKRELDEERCKRTGLRGGRIEGRRWGERRSWRRHLLSIARLDDWWGAAFRRGRNSCRLD